MYYSPPPEVAPAISPHPKEREVMRMLFASKAYPYTSTHRITSGGGI